MSKTFAAFTLTAFLAACPTGIFAKSGPPSRTIDLKPVEWEKLSNTKTGNAGTKALAINPRKWKHAETDNYVVHYRRVTEARKVVRELEFNLWFVAKALHADQSRLKRKGHAFVFEDADEWKEFLSQTDFPEWSDSLAIGDELFLNLRPASGSRRFKSGVLAHEATHAVVARIYPRKRWPRWLNEGFAEYMQSAGVAARKNQTLKRHQIDLDHATIPVDELVKMSDYPTDRMEVTKFYQSSEKLVRFLMMEFPEDKFPTFVNTVLDGISFDEAVVSVYSDQVSDYEDFSKEYAKFGR